MTPVTEDQVQSLMDGLERREKAALRALAASTETMPAAGGRMTARVLGFARAATQPQTSRAITGPSEPVTLAAERAKRQRRRTSKGFFLYSVGKTRA
ncbi:hypothetical protein GQ651_16210 [Alphaproteobacteria bacterium GH1-50]|uniref:Uncharacterized protein n=1 Tax=Kangsaoukella pontilimi TaxID=2691042 RepID=A0A7C9MF99_9RHOB|nr:hypothetical protein [Kangsaoukella pontilimi]MXQ09391.1 hypothetical protein [Kangsaoukella pontilimi]